MTSDPEAATEDVEMGANDKTRLEVLDIQEEVAGTKVRVVFSPVRADAGVKAAEEGTIPETGGNKLARFVFLL